MLLHGLTRTQLDDFVRIMRELENGFDQIMNEDQTRQKIIGRGRIAEIFPPSDHRSIREQRGGYRDE